MARPAKKRSEPGTQAASKILPMELRMGDHITDETGEWEVIAHPYATAGGKSTNVRVQRVDQPGVTETRTWGSYERVTVVRRVSSE